MMFYDDKEGEGGKFGSPTGGSKLSSLFGMDRATNQGGNESLTYTAPKQPKKNKGNTQDERKGLSELQKIGDVVWERNMVLEGKRDGDFEKDREGNETANSSAGGQSALLLAVAVHAYRFSNGTYIKHGKLGAAILGNHVANDYKILLYISKQQQVTHARITPSFVFTVQANNYATFYDEQRQNWSVMFESEQNAVDFAKQVGLAKLNASGGATKGVLGQDLVIGMGDPIQAADSIEVKYTGWLYQNKSFGNIFDSNVGVDKAFRFKIGKGKVIKGWEEGVLGMKKSGRRLLLIPPSKGYGKKGLSSRIPPNATLIFDVEIKKVKVGKDRDDGAVSSDAVESSRSDESQFPPPRTELRRDNSKSDSPPPPKHVETEDELPSMDRLHRERAFDDSVNSSRSPSANEQMSSSPSTSKAKLISRMAKMGQPMLPMQGAVVATDSTDSEADENSASSDTGRSPSPTQTLPRKPMKVPRKCAAQPVQPVAQQVQPQTTAADSFGQNSSMAQSQHQIAVYQSAPMGGQGQALPIQQQQQFPGYPQQPMYPQQSTQNQQMVPQQDLYGNAVYSGVSQPMMQPAIHSVHVPVLLTEARQHHLNIQDSVSKVSDKIETLSIKVDNLQINSSNQLNLAHNATSIEAGVLMSNIQRIVQENEKLKKELHERNNKIDVQNEKIAELLQRNQMYVEQSHSILEQRNDSFLQTTAQSQARVLELEQEKVQLSTELSNTTAKISSVQLEVSALQQKENQLKIQLAAALSQAQERLSEVDSLKDQYKDTDRKVSDLAKQLKDEKSDKKALSTKLQALEEEFADSKTERDILEKAVVERKRKAAVEKEKSEFEMEELKRMYEDELNVLKTKLKQQKSNVDVATAEQVTQIERELEAQWKERSERLLAQAQDKHDRMYNELVEEKELLSKKLTNTEQKMVHLRSSQGDSKEEAESLKEQLEEMAVWKEKYENLHSGAVSMKERYESRIKELMQEKAANAASSPQSNVIDEVKKIMNNVYHTLRNEFDPASNYKGSEILNIIMNTIKTVTMNLMSPSPDSEEEEEDSEEESDEEIEEEEDSNEDKEQQLLKKTSEETTSQQKEVVTESAQGTSSYSIADQVTTTHSEADRTTSAQADQAPSEADQAPSEADQAPSEADQAPSEADLAPSEADQAPSVADQAPSEADRAPSEADQASLAPSKYAQRNLASTETKQTSSAPIDADHVTAAPGEDTNAVQQPPVADTIQHKGENASVREEMSDQEEQESEPEDSREHSSSEPSTVEDQSASVSGTEVPPDLPEVDQKETTPLQQTLEKAVNLQEASQDAGNNATDDIESQSDDMDFGSTEDDLPDFSSPGDTTEEHDQALPPHSQPPPFISDIPPELPADNENKAKPKNTGMEDIFGSDDEDDFFTTPAPIKKSKQKGEAAAPPKSAPPKLNNNDEKDDLKPEPPPPLFGDDDDDDDDLDWLT